MVKLISLFPKQEEFWKKALSEEEALWEIRLRVGLPACVILKGREYFLGQDGTRQLSLEGAKVFSGEELSGLLLHLCKYSPYAHEEEFREGYLTLEGGHRLGIAGQVVLKHGEVTAIRQVGFMNLRVAHQVFGIGKRLLPYLFHQGQLFSVLLISPPGGGKTTLLRDLIRLVSNGSKYARGLKVGVVDERSELAGSYRGVPQNDLGIRTDVMDGCPKEIGMKMMLRSMAPEVLAVDELGTGEDRESVREAIKSGVKVLATIHGSKREDVARNGMEEYFDCFCILERNGTGFWITDYWERGRNHEIPGCHNGSDGMLWPELPIPLQAEQEDT